MKALLLLLLLFSPLGLFKICIMIWLGSRHQHWWFRFILLELLLLLIWTYLLDNIVIYAHDNIFGIQIHVFLSIAAWVGAISTIIKIWLVAVTMWSLCWLQLNLWLGPPCRILVVSWWSSLCVRWRHLTRGLVLEIVEHIEFVLLLSFHLLVVCCKVWVGSFLRWLLLSLGLLWLLLRLLLVLSVHGGTLCILWRRLLLASRWRSIEAHFVLCLSVWIASTAAELWWLLVLVLNLGWTLVDHYKVILVDVVVYIILGCQLKLIIKLNIIVVLL